MPASIFSETELARLASFPEEIPGDDLIRAFTLTGADRDFVAIRRGGSKPLGASASALCTSLPRLRSAPFERSSAIGRLLCRGPARGQPGRDSILRSTRADALHSTSPRFGNTSASRCSGHGTWKNSKLGLSNGSKVISSTVRDATYVLDEILDNQTDLPILEHTTDTAGYTEIVFALFHLLGLQFAPRIRDLGAQHLYRLDAPPRKEGVARFC